MRIAVCDDDLRELREIMSLIEEYPRKAAYGISATAFSNSEELAERIGEFDVFLLDYRMPDIDGLELARRIREEYMTTKTIIFISQYDDIVYDAFEVHAHRYLTKPVEKEKLYRALNELDKDAYSFRRLLVRNGGDSKLIDIDSICYQENSVCRVQELRLAQDNHSPRHSQNDRPGSIRRMRNDRVLSPRLG